MRESSVSLGSELTDMIDSANRSPSVDMCSLRRSSAAIFVCACVWNPTT